MEALPRCGTGLLLVWQWEHHEDNTMTPPLGASRVALMAASVGGIDAEGGTETEYDGYKVHTFTASGTFTLTSPATLDVDYLVVAGGGGGGSREGAGAGAGGMVVGAAEEISAGDITITIGAGYIFKIPR